MKEWKNLSSYRQRKIVFTGRKMVAVEYLIPSPASALIGRTLAFFSDLHWQGEAEIENDMLACFRDFTPDWLVYGGDLVSYTCFFEPAMNFLAKLKAGNAKLAVLGNWEKRRVRWLPHQVWHDAYAASGFRLLVNAGIEAGGIYFYGLDDKLGRPGLRFDAHHEFTCLLSHNPDTVFLAAGPDELAKTDLILCGHTHAGQIRIPGFGALKTSSRYWKKFEYGHYYNSRYITDMLVTGGVGTSAAPFRLFCEPELVLIRFVNKG